MSVELYQKGEQRDINGLMCDTMLVAPELFDVKALPFGWFLTPRDAHRDTKEEAEEKNRVRLETQQFAIDNSFQDEVDNEEIKEETETKASPKAEEKPEEVKVLKGNAKIRNDAKEAGIEDWETARTKTLEKKLKA